jgi:TonB family protein
MSDPANEPRWSRSRWCWSVGGVFLLQLAFVFLLSDHSVVSPRKVEAAGTFGLVSDPDLTRQLNRVVSADDPTLFALPNMKGFAGPAWLQAPVFEHSLGDWTDDERWLKPPEEKFGVDFGRYVKKITITRDQAPEKPSPQVTAVTVVDPPVALDSQLQLLGDIQSRPLLTPLQLPGWPNIDLRSRTVVEVAVNAEGGIVSATLLATNGFPVADKQALELVRNARFEPLKREVRGLPGGLMWGQMVFQWRPTPPSKTNPAEVNP